MHCLMIDLGPVAQSALRQRLAPQQQVEDDGEGPAELDVGPSLAEVAQEPEFSSMPGREVLVKVSSLQHLNFSAKTCPAFHNG